MRAPTLPFLRPVALALLLVACDANRLTAPVSQTAQEGLVRSIGTAHVVVPPLDPAGVRISEFHYDNTSNDAGEAIEVSAPVGTNLTGWTIVRYNGGSTAATAAAATVYTTPAGTSLSGVVVAPATPCGTRGVALVTYVQDGLQNGAPDGFALVNPSNQVVEFLSYEGVLTASNGPAAGMASTNVGVTEPGNEVGTSIKRIYNATTSTFSWAKSTPTSFGSCNDDNSGSVTPPPVVASVTVSPASATLTAGGTQQLTATAFDASSAPIAGATFTWSTSAASVATVSSTGLVTAVTAGDAQISATSGGQSGSSAVHVNAMVIVPMPDIRFSELHYDNAGADVGERLEIEGPAGTSLAGWSIVLYDGGTFNSVTGGSYATQSLTGALSAASCNARGVLVADFAQIQNGSPDGFALVDNTGHVVEFLSYEGTLTAANGPAAGTTSVDIGAAETGSGPLAGSIRRTAGNTWAVQAANNFGSVNDCGGPALDPPPSTAIVFTGRDPVTDAPVPVGFESQLFASETVNGATATTTITWESLTPTIATIDQKGVFHGVSAGTATFRATATDGTTATRDMPIETGTHSSTNYTGNTLFGEPADGDASDDFIVRRPEYTTSYSRIRNTPNWVSYRVLADYHPSGIDRCNCFTADPALPPDFAHYTTGDYTGAGAFAGYGIDRGHLARSFDRTAASLDNAATYYFSNIVPQAADLNQGPWKILEDNLGDSAYVGGRSVYVITGVIGNKGSVKGEGLITIPTATWKVAVIMPHDATLADIHAPSDVTVIAVVMPNDPGVRSVPWATYKTTVDEVEHQSGYDILSALPLNLQRAIQSNDTPPVARVTGATTGVEGTALSFEAGTSSDADAGDVLTYSWTFGDGAMATGVSVSHSYADNGSYTVTVTATDSHGVTSEATLTVMVANVPPTATLTAPGAGTEGSAFTLSLGNATDAGTADAPQLVFAFDCGAGLGAFSASATVTCTPVDEGTLTVHAVVRDKDGGETTYDATVVIANVAPTAVLSAPASVVEGSSFTLSLGSVFDPGTGDHLSFAFDCGASYSPSATASASCSSTDNGTLTVHARVMDEDGGVSTYDATVTVTNAAPVVTGFSAPTAPVARGASAAMTVHFTDAGPTDTHTLTVDWGDGSSSTVNAGLALTATATHNYSAAGFYTLQGVVRDKDGAAAALVSASIVVYDTRSALKTNGWFYDPTVVPAPTNNRDKDKVKAQSELSFDGGRWNGSVELENKGSALHLHSSRIDYLVVTGAIATVRGVGTIEDGPQVGFLAIARDGKLAGDKQDKVRYKIWNLATGAVLYDTEPGVAETAVPGTLFSGEVKIGK